MASAGDAVSVIVTGARAAGGAVDLPHAFFLHAPERAATAIDSAAGG